MNKIVRSSARRILAVGAPDAETSSTLEEALAADGMLILMESDPGRAEEARRRLHAAGLDKRATIIAGDPRRMLYKLAGPFDVIFCRHADAAIREKLKTLLAPGGTLIANEKTDDA